jgi:hypothetical protein
MNNCWQDGRVESELRNKFAATLMMQHYQEIVKELSTESQESEGSNNAAQKGKVPRLPVENGRKRRPPTLVETKVDSQSDDSASEDNVKENPPADRDSQEAPGLLTTASPKKAIRIPEYIFDYAEKLRKEDKVIIFVDKFSLMRMCSSLWNKFLNN